MTRTDSLAVKNQSGLPADAELTTSGLKFSPSVDIFETDQHITLVADMPGVAADGLDIDLRDNILTLNGTVSGEESNEENVVLREYQTGDYYRRFSLSEVIDQEKINADLKNGVLRLTLPKVAKATPRKITINTD
ncbi:MAG: heat-shock protein Hsp20 [Desulfobacterales bacterium]|nr:MAG: heat-shock protein Hsp20 [Desulfobacterales bacterium]